MRLIGDKQGKILCGKCKEFFILQKNKGLVEFSCGHCQTKYIGEAFKVDDQYISKGGFAELAQSEEAQCFFHTGKKAEAICKSCGRMLCSLCNIKKNDESFCSECLNKRGKGKRINLNCSKSYTEYARITLLLALFIPLAPSIVGIIYSARGLSKKEYRQFDRNKLKLIVYLVLHSIIILLIMLFIGMVIYG